MSPRREGQPGYLGPASEAERAREILQARQATPRRSTKPQDDPATLALFSAALEPSLF
jgi:hypothetical protein